MITRWVFRAFFALCIAIVIISAIIYFLSLSSIRAVLEPLSQRCGFQIEDVIMEEYNLGMDPGGWWLVKISSPTDLDATCGGMLNDAVYDSPDKIWPLKVEGEAIEHTVGEAIIRNTFCEPLACNIDLIIFEGQLVQLNVWKT